MNAEQQINDLKHRLNLAYTHNRKLLGCLKLIAAIPVEDLGSYYHMRQAHRLAVKGAWHTLYDNDQFAKHADSTMNQAIQATEGVRQLARAKRKKNPKPARNNQPEKV